MVVPMINGKNIRAIRELAIANGLTETPGNKKESMRGM